MKKYRTIPQLLGKMEEVIAGTNSGKSQQMLSYYQYWERCVFNALNETVLRAMAKLSDLMQERCGRSSKPTSGHIGTSDVVPLFKVLTVNAYVVLSDPDCM